MTAIRNQPSDSLKFYPPKFFFLWSDALDCYVMDSYCSGDIFLKNFGGEYSDVWIHISTTDNISVKCEIKEDGVANIKLRNCVDVVSGGVISINMTGGSVEYSFAMLPQTIDRNYFTSFYPLAIYCDEVDFEILTDEYLEHFAERVLIERNIFVGWHVPKENTIENIDIKLDGLNKWSYLWNRDLLYIDKPVMFQFDKADICYLFLEQNTLYCMTGPDESKMINFPQQNLRETVIIDNEYPYLYVMDCLRRDGIKIIVFNLNGRERYKGKLGLNIASDPIKEEPKIANPDVPLVHTKPVPSKDSDSLYT